MGDTGQTDKSSSTSSSNTSIDERVGASDNASALHLSLGDLSGENSSVNYTNVPDSVLALIGGVIDRVSGSTDELLQQNRDVTNTALQGYTDLKASELTGGATDLQKTALVAIAIVGGTFVLVKVLGKK